MNAKLNSYFWNDMTRHMSGYWVEAILLFIFMKAMFAFGLYVF